MTTEPTRPPAGPDFPVVGVVSSAGGLDALGRLFGAAPPAPGMAFVLVPHLDPGRDSLMPELIARHTRMPVVQATEGVEVAADHVYLIPPNATMRLTGGSLRLTPPDAAGGATASLDDFLASLAADAGARAVGVVLSGTGGHGTRGLRAVREAGGRTVVQDPATAAFPAMPRAAIDAGLADEVLAPEAISAALARPRRVRPLPSAAGVAEVVDVIRRRPRAAWEIVRAAGEEWLDDRAPRIGAALAFFTALSLAPLLVIALALAGLVYGEEAARGEVAGGLAGLVGADAARTVEGVLATPGAPRAGVVSLAVGLVTLVVGATGVFVELQEALNDVWKVRPRPGRPVRTFVRARATSAGMVLGVGFLLLVSLILGSGIDAVGRSAAGQAFGSGAALPLVNLALAFAVEVVLFGMIFKVLPDAALAWRDVLTGAVVTAVLFTLGKYLVGLFLGYSGVATAFGAAGSLMAFLVWLYYSALVLVFGAEVAKVTAARAGRRIPPAAHAEVIPGAATPVSDGG